MGVENGPPNVLVTLAKEYVQIEADTGNFCPDLFSSADTKPKVKPFVSNGDAGHVTSSHAPFIGSAGMVGYSAIQCISVCLAAIHT